MPLFIANSAILKPQNSPEACATDALKMFDRAGIKDVALRKCYCCSEYRRVVFVVEGANQNSVLKAFNRINVPIESIMETKEISTEVTTSTIT